MHIYKCYPRDNVNIWHIDVMPYTTPENRKNLHNLKSKYISCTSLLMDLTNEKMYTYLKKITQTWFAGLRVFQGLAMHAIMQKMATV